MEEHGGKYLGTVSYEEMVYLIGIYQGQFGDQITVVTKPKSQKVNESEIEKVLRKANEIEIHAGKHAPIWFKKKGGQFEVFSDFMPDETYDCASLCKTRHICRGLEDLAIESTSD